MQKLVVFIKKNCPQCPLAKKVAKEVAEELGLKYEEIDIEKDFITALQYNVVSTPSIAYDEELLFRGEVPTKDELKREILRLMKMNEEG
ncbi:MAG TPA: thioredoxin family protein [Archaeoglobus profundus]|nr:thioredoxin family protein [Archaeoglobus profundus]